MNKIIIICFFISIIFMQDIRYLDEIFDNVNKTEDVIYGNSPDLPFIFLFEWNTQDLDLTMDVYEPEGDTLSNRPAIIFMHSGSFFSGNNTADDVVDLSITSAKRGYVAFNMNYRLGLNILSTYSGERAVYRGMQDGSALVRYLREFHEDYNIDPNKIFMWGSSAGSFIGLHLAYSQDDERPESSYGSGNDPDLGCIDCAGNSYLQDSTPNALVSCWGAIGNLDWIDLNDNVPTIMFHGNLDPIVPFNSGYPFTIDIALPLVYGSNSIHNKLNELGIENQLHIGDGEFHEYWGTLNGNWFGGPNANYIDIKNNAFSFLYNQLDVIIGDINSDNIVDILDIVQVINLVLNGSYDIIADLNNDNSLDILDIVLIINLVLNENE